MIPGAGPVAFTEKEKNVRSTWNAGGILGDVSIELAPGATPVPVLGEDFIGAYVVVPLATGVDKIVPVFCGPAAPLPAKLWPMELDFGAGCTCDWLGIGTPEHTSSPLCRSLRPDAERAA